MSLVLLLLLLLLPLMQSADASGNPLTNMKPPTSKLVPTLVSRLRAHTAPSFHLGFN